MKINPAKALIVIAALGLQALLSSGCASGYTRQAGSAGAPFRVTIQNPVSDVTVTLTPEVREKLKDSLKFDQQAFVGKVELALSNNQLFSKEKKAGTVTVEIVLTHVRIRNTFNAMVWGAMSGNDSLKGDVKIKGENGTVMDQFHVDASYALGGWGGGQDAARMNWLYEAFAKEMVKALTGEPKKT